MRRSGWIVGTTLLTGVVVMGLNSGPVTSSQALRAARSTPPVEGLSSGPFCRTVHALRVDDLSDYEGSDEHLANLAALESVATPSIRQSIVILREHHASTGVVDREGETLHGPTQVKAATAAIDDYVARNCSTDPGR